MVAVQVDPVSTVLGLPLRALRLTEGVLVTAILRGGEVIRFFAVESPDPSSERLTSRLRDTAKNL